MKAGAEFTCWRQSKIIYIFKHLFKKPQTLQRRRFSMAHKITDACLACGTCVPECPVEAISEGDPIYVIDAGKCTDCGACASVCPAEAIIKA
jgi:ferredoxin